MLYSRSVLSEQRLGMTGFDSVINGGRQLLSGMATVPDTHMLHPTNANTAFRKAAEAGEVLAAKLGLTPALAFA